MEPRTKQDFLTVFDALAYSRNRFAIFHDFIMLMALSYANSVVFRQNREDEYIGIVKRYSKPELQQFVQLNTILVSLLEQDRKQDFLGQFWMDEGYGDVKKGQYSSPYDIADLCVRLSCGGGALQREIEDTGWVSVLDCAAGSCIMLIAAANYMLEKQINLHLHAMFVAQELDPLIAHMGYIQMTLMGLPGYVVVGDALAAPVTGPVLFPPEDALITPTFLLDPWHTRRTIYKMNLALGLYSGAGRHCIELARPRT